MVKVKVKAKAKSPKKSKGFFRKTAEDVSNEFNRSKEGYLGKHEKSKIKANVYGARDAAKTAAKDVYEGGKALGKKAIENGKTVAKYGGTAAGGMALGAGAMALADEGDDESLINDIKRKASKGQPLTASEERLLRLLQED